MTDTSKLCMGCMSMKENEGKCSHCGYLEPLTTANKSILPPRTILQDRYLVGKMTAPNGENITYVGYDLDKECRVTIKEYMPARLCSRNPNGTLAIHLGSETNYKTLMAEYEDILKALQKLDLPGVIPVEDVFHENNTVYGVFRFIQTIPLSNFLSRCGGELTWSQTRRIFAPLFSTISTFHTRGIIHRGLSPQTVSIDKDGHLWISDFATAALRTDKSEIDTQLFTGYCAPEQYAQDGWQGSWTDVYALAALMYKSMTGTMPPQGDQRKVNDNLCPCFQLNPAIPQGVSNAISRAMTVQMEQRTQTVAEFSAELFAAASSQTKSTDQVQRTGGSSSVRKKKKKKPSNGILVGFLTLIISIVALTFCARWFYDTYLSNNAGMASSSQPVIPQEGSSVPNTVPRFVGMTLESVQSNVIYQESYVFSTQFQENDEYPEGTIFSQDPEYGTPLRNKGNVTLYVSTGSQIVFMPNLVGETVERAQEILSTMGVKNVDIVHSYEKGDPDTVLRTNIAPDTPFKKNTDRVMLIIAAEMPEPEEPEEGENSGEEEDPNESSSSSSKRTDVIVINP